MDALPTLNEIEESARVVYRHMHPTPQYSWPLLSGRLAVDLWLKHENHTPLGAFKIRGGITFFHSLGEKDLPQGVVCATRGNHGQSVARAATMFKIPSTIVVPFGNSESKNAAMKALGSTLIEHGSEFQESLEYAQQLADRDNLMMVPSFHRQLVSGVATCGWELLQTVKNLDVVYVPIGLGSGICGMMAARDGLGVPTQIVGVVSSHAMAYKKSFDIGRTIESPVSTMTADGMACRTPNNEALPLILKGVSRIVNVTDAEVEQAMRDIFDCTHQVAEGAGAAAVAAVAKDAAILKGKRVGAVLSGGNIDRSHLVKILSQ